MATVKYNNDFRWTLIDLEFGNSICHCGVASNMKWNCLDLLKNNLGVGNMRTWMEKRAHYWWDWYWNIPYLYYEQCCKSWCFYFKTFYKDLEAVVNKYSTKHPLHVRDGTHAGNSLNERPETTPLPHCPRREKRQGCIFHRLSRWSIHLIWI